MKPSHIYAKNIEEEAMNQYNAVMALDNVVAGALMPDAHTGYVLPIGAVVAVRGAIYPAFIGYDIGCGVLAYQTDYKLCDVLGKEQEIFHSIYRTVPCGEGRSRSVALPWDYSHLPHSPIVDEAMKKHGAEQIGTLGGGNHFIEISHDAENTIWVVIHSGSRGVGHKVATHYMALAKQAQSCDTSSFEADFDAMENSKRLKEYNIEKYEEQKGNYVQNQIKKTYGKNNEGTFALDVESDEGKAYIQDMEFCLAFALENRAQMLYGVLKDIDHAIGGAPKDRENLTFINRNHNHAEYRDGLWIHRKGATHAEEGMLGVIPGNMRDGSFIVCGKGNPDSLYSSSHGGGRTMSRKRVVENVKMEDFTASMEGITAKVDKETLDECPMAYKDIFEVMDLQKDLVDVVAYLKPIINVKG